MDWRGRRGVCGDVVDSEEGMREFDGRVGGGL